jgi:hypothetical protein
VADDGGASEVERLRLENIALHDEIERVSGVKRRRLRSVAAAVAVVVAVASFAVALPGAWVRRTITDTDTYLSVVDPLAADPAIQEALSREITTAVFGAVDVQARVEKVLTRRAPQLTFLAGPITASVQQFVQGQVATLVGSEEFRTVWNQANRIAQTQLVAVLQGNSDVLAVQNGQVVLNYLPIVNQALQQVSGLLGTLLDRPITLPAITADTLPADAIARLEAALGVDLPDQFGTAVVYRTDVLTQVQDGVKIARRLLIAVVALFVIGLIVAIAVSPRRRRTVLEIAIAIAVITVIERRIAIYSVNDVVGMVPAASQAATRAVADAIVDWFLQYTVVFLWVALLTIVVALVSGPYPWALWFRAAVDDVVHHTLRSEEPAADGTPSAWIATHRMPVMAGIAVLAAVVFWVSDVSAGWSLALAVVVVVLELAAWRVARGPSDAPVVAA